ncbi:MFS transporter [Nioella sp.]|uniref:MFS transporter n=1 Tax=Nioella sp. TaxID=1912091 RepID=UPI003512A7D5
MRARPELAARGPAVWMLAVGQTLSYACLYYIFAALILSWEADLHWPRSLLATGPFIAIVISAALAPFAGRLVDLGKGPEAMVAGSVIGAGALVLLATSQSQGAYLLAWAVIGLAQSVTLYETCFAFLIRRLGPHARAAIVRVTLVAGFASTIAFPAGAALSAWIGWRGAVWVAAGVMAFVLVPIFALAGRMLRRVEGEPDQREADKGALSRAMRAGTFWLLALVFALVALNHWMLISYAVPIFVEQGAGEALAVFAASTVGPAQVAGRLVLMRFEARIGTAAATRVTFVAMLAGTAALWLAGLSPWLIFGFTAIQGAAIGVMTILRPVLISEVLGPAGYGAIAGTIQIPALLAGAAAPVVGAFVLDHAHVPGLIALSAGLIGLSSLLAWRLAGQQD